MTRRFRNALFALAAAAATAGVSPATAQTFPTHAYATCVPGVGCSQIRFFLQALEPGLELNDLTLSLTTDRWRFLPNSGPGTYGARDDVGDFGGSSDASLGGSRLFINFLETGAPFTLLLSGNTGFIDFEVDNLDGATDASGFAFDYTGNTAGGEVIAESVVPEPVTMSLLGTGLLGVAAARRRRRREQTEA